MKLDTNTGYTRLEDQPPLSTGELMTSYGFAKIMSMMWVPAIILIILITKIIKTSK